MSDELVVSGGGSTAVAVDELFVDAARLSAVEATTADWSARAGVIRRGVRGLDLDPAMDSWETRSPTWLLEHADRCLRHQATFGVHQRDRTLGHIGCARGPSRQRNGRQCM